jgi:hypothetical protein
MKNTQNKTRELDNPYEIWETQDMHGKWTWKVLKKYQADDDKPYARWLCGVKSPFTYGSYEMGDVYVSEIKEYAVKVFDEQEVK